MQTPHSSLLWKDQEAPHVSERLLRINSIFVTLLTCRSGRDTVHTTGRRQQIDQQAAVIEGRYVESDIVTRQQKKAHHQAEVEDAANDIKARVFEAEEVQVLAAQLHAAGGGGVGCRAVVLPAPP